MTTTFPPATDAAPTAQPPAPGRLQRFVQGPEADPTWARPALLVLLASTAVLYLWDLGASGYANTFYAQAVQAGTLSWKAMLFGSLDPHNVITVDKPAMSLWPMEISGRVFGFSSWSMLVPQAIEGVATVALAHAAVKRVTGKAIFGLLAGLTLAITPVAVLMFRFNNPDALLVLLLTAAAYTTVRALESASWRWMIGTGLLVGLGFITKSLQAMLVVPGLTLAYLLCAPTTLWSRVKHLLLGGAALLIGAGWWIALVTWWPGSKPYIGGSGDGTELGLAFGYNGAGRIFGGSGNGGGGGRAGGLGGGPGGGGNSSFGGSTGLERLFRSDMSTEISWLLPTALLALLVGLYLGRRAPRTDMRRAGLIVFGGSMLVTGLVFSEMKGTIHPYYTIALAPLIAGTVAIAASLLWEQRSTWTARIAAAVLIETTVVWDLHLLGSWKPEIKALLVVASIIGVTALIWGNLLTGALMRRLVAVGLVASLLAGLGASTAWAVSTASHPHSGSIPTSGPATSQGGFGGGGGEGTADAALVTLLKTTTTKWAAAASSAGSSAPLQLASGKAVIAIGGFNGGDPAPTLAQFEAYVKAGQISYYVAGGRGGFGGGRGGNNDIASWVEQHYTSTTVGGSTVYDLRAATS